MDNLNVMNKTKSVLWLFVQWILGLFFLLCAFVSLFGLQDNFIGFVITLALGVALVPPLRALFTSKGKKMPTIALSPKKRKFKKEMSQALDDGVLTDEEARHLEQKAEELGIQDEYVDKLRHKDFEGRVKPILNDIEQTRRYSPEHEKQLKEMAEQLQIKGEFGPEFKMFRDLWEYENNGVFPLERIDPPILLKNNEECYFECPAVWKQVKTMKQYKGHTGASVGFRVMKGVRFSVGRAMPMYDEVQEMRPLSDGEIYVTNKKIIFNGSAKSTNITVGRIVQVQLYGDGIEVRKTSGKPDFFQMAGVHAEYISALIHNMMNNT